MDAEKKTKIKSECPNAPLKIVVTAVVANPPHLGWALSIAIVRYGFIGRSRRPPRSEVVITVDRGLPVVRLGDRLKEIEREGVIGAIDESRIPLKTPKTQQESYTDRHFEESIILQAVCTSEKVFTNVRVGYPRRGHNARVLSITLARGIDSCIGNHVTKCTSVRIVAD
uniref:Uncharacterized protein n=1 Tax=Timema cristinae TaxID=61476 RepID=A0A7R9H4W2_TIMCR|nr:unnamed protein product [Timema cristinae]